MLKIRQFAFNFFNVNTYLAYDSDSLEAIVIDPGMVDQDEEKLFDSYVEQNKLKITLIVNTHLHLDHCFGNNYVKSRYGVEVAASPLDATLGALMAQQGRMFGIDGIDNSHNVSIDRLLHEGDVIMVGKYRFTVLEVPGHSPGGIVLYCAQARCAFVGDSIFYGSIGRTDLSGGDTDTLIGALHAKVLTLPDDTTLYTGHYRPTTVAQEKASNLYLR